jgi:hypothetical protein
MQNYLLLAVLVLLINSLPAFAPPTWAILVFFLINFQLSAFVLVIIGVLSATTRRAFLAWYFRRFAHLVPISFRRNMDYLGDVLQGSDGKKFTILGLFLISPIPSAQLFEAAGLMKTVKLRPLLVAFALGRTVSYTTYLTGASFVSDSSIGDLIIRELKSTLAISTQIALIIGLMVIGNIDWRKRVKSKTKG